MGRRDLAWMFLLGGVATLLQMPFSPAFPQRWLVMALGAIAATLGLAWILLRRRAMTAPLGGRRMHLAGTILMFASLLPMLAIWLGVEGNPIYFVGATFVMLAIGQYLRDISPPSPRPQPPSILSGKSARTWWTEVTGLKLAGIALLVLGFLVLNGGILWTVLQGDLQAWPFLVGVPLLLLGVAMNLRGSQRPQNPRTLASVPQRKAQTTFRFLALVAVLGALLLTGLIVNVASHWFSEPDRGYLQTIEPQWTPLGNDTVSFEVPASLTALLDESTAVSATAQAPARATRLELAFSNSQADLAKVEVKAGSEWVALEVRTNHGGWVVADDRLDAGHLRITATVQPQLEAQRFTGALGFTAQSWCRITAYDDGEVQRECRPQPWESRRAEA